jgi:hypothetical protein
VEQETHPVTTPHDNGEQGPASSNGSSNGQNKEKEPAPDEEPTEGGRPGTTYSFDV